MIFNHVYGGLKINGNEYQLIISGNEDISKGDFVSVVGTSGKDVIEVEDKGTIAGHGVIGSPTGGTCRQCMGVEVSEGRILVVFTGDKTVYGLLLDTADSGASFSVVGSITSLNTLSHGGSIDHVYRAPNGTVYMLYSAYIDGNYYTYYLPITVSGTTMSAGSSTTLTSIAGNIISCASESADILFYVLNNTSANSITAWVVDKTGVPTLKINPTTIFSSNSNSQRNVYLWQGKGIVLVTGTGSENYGSIAVVTFNGSSMSSAVTPSPILLKSNWCSSITIGDRLFLLGNNIDDSAHNQLKSVPYVECFLSDNTLTFGATKTYETYIGLPWLYRRSRFQTNESCITMWQRWDSSTSPAYSVSATNITSNKEGSLVMEDLIGLAASTSMRANADEFNYCFDTSFGKMYLFVMYVTSLESNSMLHGFVMRTTPRELSVVPYSQEANYFGVAKNSGSPGDTITLVSPLTINL